MTTPVFLTLTTWFTKFWCDTRAEVGGESAPAAEPAAPAPPVETPAAPAAPAAPSEPAAVAPVEPAAPAAAPTDPRAEQYSKLYHDGTVPETKPASTEEGIAKINARLDKLTPGAPAPAEGPAKTFMELLESGESAAAVKVLSDEIRNGLKADIEASKLDSRTITEQATAMARIERQNEQFVEGIRSQHPELAPFEGFIRDKADKLLNLAHSRGTIKSGEDYVVAYQTAVKTAVEEIQKAVGTVRAAGKDEAMVAKEQVLAASTISPTLVPQGTERVPGDQTPQDPQDAASAYIAMRQKQNDRNHSLTQPQTNVV